jgi:phage tail protein X
LFRWFGNGIGVDVSIFAGSRYEYSTIDFFSVIAGESENPTVFYEFDDLGLTSYQNHRYLSGERLDQLAYRYYSRPEMWWIIAEYNPQIDDHENIPNGTILRIPSV